MALEVTHERADAQRHLWIKAPMRVQIRGIEYPVTEWSLGGLALDGAPRDLRRPGGRVDMHVVLPFQGFDIGFDAHGEVEALSAESGRVEIGFRDLGAREHELLAHFIDQLIRGKMLAVDDTIKRLDAPLAMAGLIPSLKLPRQQPAGTPLLPQSLRQWRPVRAATMTAIYGVAGLAALGYLGTLLYTNLYWLEAQTSMISAPVEQLVALGDGAVAWGKYKPGDAVKAGDVVLTIADNILEREIEQADIGIREKENKLAFLARRFTNEKKRVGAFADLSHLKSAKGNAEIEGLNAKLAAAQRELRQLPPAAAVALAQVRQRIVNLRQAITLREFERTGLTNLAKENSGSMEFVGSTYMGEIDNVAAQIELAEADVDIAKQRWQSYVHQRDRLSVRAPFDGVLRDLPHANNANVKKGDVAAVIEGTGDRRVTAYVRQDQALRVQLGASAIVQVPATRQTYRAIVAEIDPARSQDGERGRQATAAGSAHPNTNGLVAVRLALVAAPRSDDQAPYRDGLPAVTTIGLGHVPAAKAKQAAEMKPVAHGG